VAAGYVVRVAEDGLDAIEKLRAGPADLIISDLNMPRMSGVEHLGVVRKRFPRIPVIIISGVATDEMPEDLAADACCPKNEFLSDQLLQIVSDLTTKTSSRSGPPTVPTNQSRQFRIGTEPILSIAKTACVYSRSPVPLPKGEMKI